MKVTNYNNIIDLITNVWVPFRTRCTIKGAPVPQASPPPNKSKYITSQYAVDWSRLNTDSIHGF